MNKFICTGNLVVDPEIKAIASGKFVMDARIAVNTGYGDKKKTTFLPIKAWDGIAETVANHLSKGDKALYEGELQQENWEKDGQKHSKLFLLVRSVEFLSSKKQVEPVDCGDVFPDNEIGF
jgi:single-strand DNA-binding protein